MVIRSVAFHHFGCKVNFSEGSALSREFKGKGFKIVDFHERADCYVISTCIVTAAAEKKCRAAIRQVHKKNPDAFIAVIGCYSELRPETLSGMEGVSMILGTSDKFLLLEKLSAMGVQMPDSGTDSPAPDDIGHYHGGIGNGLKSGSSDFVAAWSSDDRTRSFLKIQDGCDYFCSYCTIPLARGRSRSDTIDGVLDNARKIGATGIREMVLTGVNIGDFGRHQNENLLQLIRRLDDIGPVSRIRISSIEPDLLSDEIIEFIAASRHFMPHFHIPLQSGSDRILKQMRRKYDKALYAGRVGRIRTLLPHACIAADLITGFPGETEEDHQETITFLKYIDISYIHVFTYSARPDTRAAGFSDPVSPGLKTLRSRELHRLSEEKKRKFYRTNAGRQARVLFESSNTGGRMDGFTENYIKVSQIFDPAWINQIREIELSGLDEKEIIFNL